MIIPRATFVYICMVVILFGGLWVILEFGSTLHAPIDLAGKWELAGPNGTQEMTLEQSGRYVNIVTPKWQGAFKMNSGTLGTGTGSVRMIGNGTSASFDDLTID